MKKVFLAILILLVLLGVAVVSVPFVFKDKLIQTVNNEANKQLNAVVEIKDFSASLIQDFPNLSLGIHDFSISGRDEFEGVNLVKGKELVFTIDIFGLLKGDEIAVESIILNDGDIQVLVDENGNANYDIAKETEDAETESEDDSSQELSFKLKNWQINNSNFYYNDASMAFETRLKGISNTGSGDFTLSQFILETGAKVDTFSLAYEGMEYLSNINLSVDAALDIDLDKMFFGFKKNQAVLNDLHLSFDGSIAMPENGDIVMDLNASTDQSQLKNLLSILPAVYTEDYANIKVNGEFGLMAAVKGVFNDKSYPAINLGLEIKDGAVQYPDLPAKIDRISMKAKVESPEGEDLDRMVVDLANFHAEVANNPVDLSLLLKQPISDPDIDAKLYTKLNFATLKQAIPLDGYELAGRMNANLTMKGRLSALETERYDQFEASGSAAVKQLNISGSALDGESYTIDTAQVAFSPKLILLNTFKANIAGSNVSAEGSLSQYMAYIFKDQDLVGSLSVESDLLNANAFMTESGEAEVAEAETTEESMGYIELPKNIDFRFKSKIGKLLYDDYVIENFSGEVLLKNQQLSFNEVKMQSFGGDIWLSGYYQTREEQPKVALDFKVENLDVNKVATTVNTVEKLAPIAKRSTGKFDANFNITGALDQELNPVWSAYQGDGLVKTKSIFFENFEPVNRLADKLNIKKLAKQSIADTKVFFEIKEGRVFIKPVTTQLGDIPAKITGSTGFDQSIDYTFNLDIPRDLLGSTASNAIAGLSEKLGAESSSKIPVDVFFTNTVTDPKLRVNLGGTVSNLKDQVTTKLKNEFNAKKDSLQNEVNERLDAEKEKARQAAEEAKRKLEEEKRKAEEEAKRKAEEAKRKAEEEAKKKLKKLIKPN